MLACLRQRPMLLGAVPFGHQQLGLINRVDVVSSHLVCGTTDARSLGNYPNEGSALSQAGLRSSLPVANFVAQAVAPPDSVTSRGRVLLECLGLARCRGCRVSRCSIPRPFPARGRRWRSQRRAARFSSVVSVGRQGVGLLGLARFSGFARLKLLAVRAFEFGVTGPVQRNLRLWAGLSSNPG